MIQYNEEVFGPRSWTCLNTLRDLRFLLSRAGSYPGTHYRNLLVHTIEQLERRHGKKGRK
jgi:hypothetical protein